MTDRKPTDPLLDEVALDRLLQTVARTPMPPFPAALRARIMAAVPGRRAASSPAVHWMRAASIVAMLTAGVAAGFAGGAAAFSIPGPEQALLNLALSGPDDPFAVFLEDVSMENGA